MKVLPFLHAIPLVSAIGSRQHKRDVETLSLEKRDINPELLYPEYNISVPVDHFHNSTLYEPHSNATFDLRYWFDASHYQPGGPVIVLQSGETDASGRLPYLQKGILAQLAQATHGIGVVLEHRYYGTSFPTPDLSTKNLRFLTTEQALADEAYFARNIVFPGLEHLDLTSKSAAYLGYGGSYAGAFNAFLRVVYPDVFWGTISSSGVTKAIYNYYDYFTPIAENGPPKCISTQKTLIHIVDTILLKNQSDLTHQLKTAFGLGNLTYDDDFASTLSSGIEGWQSRNWDPKVGSLGFDRYCNNISSDAMLYPAASSLRPVVESLIKNTNYTVEETLVNRMLNFIGYVNRTSVASCSGGSTQDECFSNHNSSTYQQDDLASYTWRSWAYQYCSEWGYLQTGYAPPGQLPIVSSLLDLEYESIVCVDAFNITTPANVDAVNKYGGYDISYPRLAFVDGSADPWRPATPHAYAQGAKERNSTSSEPFILIDGAVHHWDENGLFPNETTASLPPLPVADTQRQEIQFVQEWMQEWQLEQQIKAAYRKPATQGPI
ncbi:extracelular serine carboxypeptidase [Aureobasidium pullulans]|uniref:Extracelular serine carboxypeptidase n=1 Tax=Aureobasidium pullulans TaxID=5580 RepID=A0A4S8YYG9_AURPU|nr:extracelular serine carboxypeptidase [Aureobasidium pullulans]